jgi:hypothetical protein
MKIFKWYFYPIITKKPIPLKRLEAIRQGKAWLRNRDLASAKADAFVEAAKKVFKGYKGALDIPGDGEKG